MSGETVPIERFRELVKANEKHYQEACTLKSKLTEMEQCLQWCSENVATAMGPIDEHDTWTVSFDNELELERFDARTLYQALKSAWEARDK